MKKRTATAFLFFYVAFTFLFQVERTLDWAAQSGAPGSHRSIVQARTPHAKQTRIAESGFVLHGFENAVALTGITTPVPFIPLERILIPTLRNVRPRSPPMTLQIV